MAIMTPQERGRLGGLANKIKLTLRDYKKAERLAAYLPDHMIATALDVSLATFERLKVSDKVLSRVLEKGKMKAGAAVGKVLLYHARKGNVACAIFYAKCKLGFRETLKIEENPFPKGDTETRTALAQLSAEELRQIAEIVRSSRRPGDVAGYRDSSGREESKRVH